MILAIVMITVALGTGMFVLGVRKLGVTVDRVDRLEADL